MKSRQLILCCWKLSCVIENLQKYINVVVWQENSFTQDKLRRSHSHVRNKAIFTIVAFLLHIVTCWNWSFQLTTELFVSLAVLRCYRHTSPIAHNISNFHFHKPTSMIDLWKFSIAEGMCFGTLGTRTFVVWHYGQWPSCSSLGCWLRFVNVFGSYFGHCVGLLQRCLLNPTWGNCIDLCGCLETKTST